MTLKEFEEGKAGKSQDEFGEWFDRAAWFSVGIGGIEMPCIKLTSRKVGLRDGSVYVKDREKELRRLNDSEKRSLLYRNGMMQVYDKLEVMDRLSIQEYLELLKRKSELERAMKARAGMTDGVVHCSFCRKSQNEVQKLIAGPVNVYICNECVEICDEILEEEMGTDEQGNGA